MNKKWIIYLFSISVLCPALADVIPCPSNTQFINSHEPIEQVIKKCGKPLHEIVINPKKVRSLEVWQYPKSNNSVFYDKEKGISVVFASGSVIQINEDDNKDLYALTCPNGDIEIGAPSEQVRHACGPPYSTKSVPPIGNKEFIHVPQIIKLVYKPRKYLPQTIFIFKNGFLIGKR